VKREKIIESLGIPQGQAEPFLVEQITTLIDYCSGICSPCAGYSVFSSPLFSGNEGRMHLDGITFNLNKTVAPALHKSNEIAGFIGTCGENIEQYSRSLMKEGNALEGLIVDLIGSEIAEGVAEFIHQKLENDMNMAGLKVTNRYSPGYCNWPVSDQQKLFSLPRLNTCGVRLTPSSLMLPVKSVSGIIGIGRNVVNRGYACMRCETDHCLYREKTTKK